MIPAALALLLLAAQGRPTPDQLLAQAAKDSEPEVREAAGTIRKRAEGGKTVVGAARESLKDPSPAVRELAAFLVRAEDPRDPTIAPVLAETARTRTGIRRLMAAQALLGLGKAGEALPGLLESLVDEDRQVRLLAPLALDGVESVPAEGLAALRAALSHRSYGVRGAAVILLSKQGPAGGPLVLRASVLDRSLHVREIAEKALDKIDLEPIDLFSEMLKDPDRETRVAAAITASFGALENAEAMPLLRPAEKDADAAVRGIAALGIALRTGAPAAKTSALARALADPLPEVRLAAVTSLRAAETGKQDPALLPALLLRALREEDARALFEVREALAVNYELYGSREALSSLARLLKDPDREVRLAAAYGLALAAAGEKRNVLPEATGPLGGAAKDPEASVRAMAAVAAECVEGKDLAARIRAIRDPDPDLRIGALGLARVEFKHPLAATPVHRDLMAAAAESLGAREARVRRRAAETLPAAAAGGFEEQAIAPLVRALRDPEWAVREAAAISLRPMGPQALSALPALLGALERETAGDAWTAETELARGLLERRAEAVPVLAGGLKDADRDVRRGSAGALGRMGPAARSAEGALIEASRDADEGVRKAAAEALRRILAAEEGERR
jgi:HEAT repeat protein